MKLTLKSWRQDKGSIDLIQLFVGLLIISIASVGTLSSVMYGTEQLDFQMRNRKALTIARSYVEYWQGRIHVDINVKDPRVTNGNLGDRETVLLDERDPTTIHDNIYAELAYSRIEPVPFQQVVAEGVQDHWYTFSVILTWHEPYGLTGWENNGSPPHEITLIAAMVPAVL